MDSWLLSQGMSVNASVDVSVNVSVNGQYAFVCVFVLAKLYLSVCAVLYGSRYI